MYKVTVITKSGNDSLHYFKSAYDAQEFAKLATAQRGVVKAVVEVDA